MNKEKLLNIIKASGTVLTILLFILFIYLNWEEFVYNIRLIGLSHVILLLIITFVSRFFVCLRWYYLIKVLEPKISLAIVVKITFAGLFASNFLPTTIGGDLIRVGGSISYGYNPINVTASLLLDRLIGMVGMVIALPFNFTNSLFIKFISRNPSNNDNLFLISSPIFTNITNKISSILNNIINSFILWNKHPKAIIFSLISTTCHMVILFITLWGIFEYQNVDLPVSVIAGLWSLSYFFTLIPVSVNGLGLQEVSITYLYSSVGGAPLESCLVAAIMIRILQSIASLPGVFFLTGLLNKNGKH